MTSEPRGRIETPMRNTGAGLGSDGVTSPEADAWRRTAGVALVVGALATVLLNALFPRADDPSDVVAVLTTMAEHDVRQKVSFIGGTIGLWILGAGIVGLYRTLTGGSVHRSAIWARLGFYAFLLGLTLFTASSGLGLAATGAAVEWAAAGASTTGTEFAVASTASALDDGVWAISIIALWGGLGLLGIAMLRGGRHPGWLAIPLVIVGFGSAIFAGIPMAYDGVSLTPMMVFAGLALLTSIWALVAGIWMLRQTG